MMSADFMDEVQKALSEEQQNKEWERKRAAEEMYDEYLWDEKHQL